MKTYKKNFLLLCSFVGMLFLSQFAEAQNSPDDILGTWLVEKKNAKVEIFKQGTEYFGKIIWLAEPLETDGKPKLDKENPEVSKRSQTIQGLVNVKNLQWRGKGEWEEGKVYDPKNGKTYSASVEMLDKNTLEFTGFIGVSFIGRTETWTRVK